MPDQFPISGSGPTLPVSIANGGTGSATQNFVDLTTVQASVGGAKTFTSNLTAPMFLPVTASGVIWGTSGGYGLGIAGGLPIIYIASGAKWQFTGTDLSPFVDGAGSFGTTTTRAGMVWSKAYGTASQAIAQSTATATLDASLGSVFVVTMGANVTSWNITNAIIGQHISITWVQDGTGTRTLAGANTNIKFLPTVYLATGTFSTPTLSTAIAARDYQEFVARSSTEIVEVARSFGH